jgi:hypothetical protein
MRRTLPALLASLAVVAALSTASGPASAQTASPVQVETPAPLVTPAPAVTAAPAASPAPNAPALPKDGVAPCAASDLALREVVGKAGGTPPAMWTYAVKNRGAAACRLIGSAGIRLIDARGKEIPLHFGVRTMMAMLLTLRPGAEASFTVSYMPQARDASPSCEKGARIEVFFPAQTTPLIAKSTMTGCSGLLVRVSNLRLGVASADEPTPMSQLVS